MCIPYYQVDAFTNTVFSGNPAGVCVLGDWLGDEVLQSIAFENNLSETAFIVRRDNHYEIRWFTPRVEVDLCGHATLASGHVIFETLERDSKRVDFECQSGKLSVKQREGLLHLDFPSRKPVACAKPDGIGDILGAEPVDILESRDLMVVYEDEDTIRNMEPDFTRISNLDSFAVVVTAPGKKSDFVSRFFAPNAGILEDPVTGSAHCSLVPYWAEKLGKKDLHALQLSQRGGELFCSDLGNRVSIGGSAVTYLSGSLKI